MITSNEAIEKLTLEESHTLAQKREGWERIAEVVRARCGLVADFQIENIGFANLPLVRVKLKGDAVWAYGPCVKLFKDERPIEVFSGWTTIEEAERIHAKIGEAIRIAKDAQQKQD